MWQMWGCSYEAPITVPDFVLNIFRHSRPVEPVPQQCQCPISAHVSHITVQEFEGLIPEVWGKNKLDSILIRFTLVV